MTRDPNLPSEQLKKRGLPKAVKRGYALTEKGKQYLQKEQDQENVEAARRFIFGGYWGTRS